MIVRRKKTIRQADRGKIARARERGIALGRDAERARARRRTALGKVEVEGVEERNWRQ